MSNYICNSDQMGPSTSPSESNSTADDFSVNPGYYNHPITTPVMTPLPWLVCEDMPLERAYSHSFQFLGHMTPMPCSPALPMMGPQGMPSHFTHLAQALWQHSNPANMPPQQQLNPNAKPYVPMAPQSPWGQPSRTHPFKDNNTGHVPALAEFRRLGTESRYDPVCDPSPLLPKYREQQPQQCHQSVMAQYRGRVKPSSSKCMFCIRNGEEDVHHLLKDAHGRTVCPVLRAFRCKLCGATGDRAHTLKYCPRNTLTRGNPRALGLQPGLLPVGITDLIIKSSKN